MADRKKESKLSDRDKQLSEKMLDSSLLSGSIDVDDYATALLTQHSLEHANREVVRLKKEMELLKSERVDLLTKLSENGITLTADKKTGATATTEDDDRKRKFPAVAALYESRSKARNSLEPLVRVQQSHVKLHAPHQSSALASTADGGQADPINLWYADTFSNELRAIKSAEEKVAGVAGPSDRELHLEEELVTLKAENERLKHSTSLVSLERDELFQLRQDFENELEQIISERDQALATKTGMDTDFIKMKEEKEKLEQLSKELDLKSRSISELNKALQQKVSLVEDQVKQELNRTMKAYDFIYLLQKQIEMRSLLRQWKDYAVESKRLAMADLFRERKLVKKVMYAWDELTFEQARGRAAQNKVQTRMLTFLFRGWSKFAQDSAKRHRTADLYSRMIEAKKVRECFREWRQFANLKKNIEDGSGSSEKMQLSMLRTVAAKAKVPAIMYAAARGMTDLVIELINEGSSVNMKERGTGATPLHSGAESGSVAVVEVLLEAGGNPSTTDDQGETPLQKVAKKGAEASVDVALALLRHGADPTFVASKDGRSLLHLALDAGAGLPLLSVLLQYRSPIDQQHPGNGRTALHACASRGDFVLLDAMLKHAISTKLPGFASKFPVDVSGQTPLHAACASESPDMPKCLTALIDAGFDINAESASGERPLHIFCQNSTAHPATLAILLPSANLEAQDINGNTALHFACLRQIRGVALELVSLGAPLYLINTDERSPLDLVPQGFAIKLLASIREAPILSRAERAHRQLDNCMVCKDAFVKNLLRQKNSDHCRHCGRLCCAKCTNHRMTLPWETQGQSSKVCQHCAEVLMDTTQAEEVPTPIGDNV